MELENTDKQSRKLHFEFTGTGTEYFRIWIVNIFLSIITLGVYSAWAKVRTQSYFYGNTLIDGKNFTYLANPLKILYGRIIAVILFSIYWYATKFHPESLLAVLTVGLLLFPFLLVTVMSFRLRYSSYRNIRFYFSRDLAGAYKTFLPIFLLTLLLSWFLYHAIEGSKFFEMMINNSKATNSPLQKENFIIITFMITMLPLLPWFDYLRSRFISNHAQYGTANFKLLIKLRKFYVVYLLAFLVYMGVITGSILASTAFIIIDSTFSLSIAPIFSVILIYSGILFVAGIWRAMHTNMIFNHLKINANAFHSKLNAIVCGWIYVSNTIVILFSVGLLIPWAMVRMKRYVASCTALEVEDIMSIRALQEDECTAFGEGMGDIFDFDLGL